MPQTLSALGREARALARQARLLRHDWLAVVPEPDAEDVAVLVHGFLATAGVLRPLARRLEQTRGVRSASFTHLPGEGIARIAERLAELVSELTKDVQRLHLIGHSVGGLAVRYFVTETGGDPRVVQSISIASPFFGLPRASLLPGQLGRDLHRESSLLARLRAGIPGSVPHFSIAGTHDAVVESGALTPSAERLLASGCGHNAVLYDPEVEREIVGRVASARARTL
jgi:alpha-beta hydrolase superfamily lysophospholipase